MKNKFLPLLLVMVLLLAALSVTAFAETKAAPAAVTMEEKAALQTALAAIPKNGKGYAYCPVCDKEALWYSQGSNGNLKLNQLDNHWFIQGDVTNTGYFYVSSGGTGCFCLNGFNVTSSSVAFESNDNATLNIIGVTNDPEKEIVTAAGYGNLAAYGDTIHTYGGTINIFGGTYQKSSSDAGPVVGANKAYALNVYEGTTIRNGVNSGNCGGNIGLYVTGTNVNIHGGTVTGGQAGNGGNIGISATGCTLNISGGTVQNGKAPRGGNIAVSAASCTVNLNGGEVKGGEATSGNGGNVIMEANSQVNINGGTVTGGKASNWGGNFYGEGGAKYVMSSGTVQTGNGKNGGNFGINNAYLTISGGTIKGGTATNGGNLYLSQYVGSSIGGATITGGALEQGNATLGGNIYMESGSNVTLAGISISGGVASEKAGNIYVAGKLTFNNGSISGGSAPNGGSMYLTSGSNASFTGTTITGGSATAGMGGVFYAAKTNLTLNNCSVSGGTATSWGGTIYADTEGCVVTVKGTTTISGGQGNMGGNITINDKAELKIESGEISGGTAANYGGNIFMQNGTLTQTGGTVKNGTSSTDRGGNVYIASGVTANISNATYEGGRSAVHGGSMITLGNTTIVNTTFTGGTATKYGGNIAVAGGTFSMTGGSISGGNASGVGGNLYTWGATSVAFNGATIENGVAPTGGNLYITAPATFTNCDLSVSASVSGSGSHFYNDGTATFTGCTLTNGTVMGDGDVVLNSTTANFSNLNMRKNTLTVSGNTTIAKATFNEPAGLHIMKNFTGTVNFASMVGAPTSPIYGKALGANYTAEGNFTGKVILAFDIEEPWVCNKNGSLMVASCRTVKDGVVTWYADSVEALAQGGDADYLWPVIDGTMELTRDCTIDLFGTNQTIIGTGNVTLFDSANADYKTYGTATVNGPVVTNAFETFVQGNAYYMIEDGNSYSFHRLGNSVNGVSLRPSAAGIYYTSIWSCDDALKALIQNFGVAVSLVEQPDANFVSDYYTLYTQFDKSEFESGVTKTSVLITEIFHEDASNNTERGKKPIYATAYVTLNNGESLCYAVDQDAQRYSLHDVLTILDQHSDDYSAYAKTLENFMTKWSAFGVTGTDWEFTFSVAPEIAQLNAMYAGKTAYQGEMHDHANTGGRSDGKQTLETWIKGMKKLGMDFATIVDHDQSRHMYLDDWKKATFIGGTETTGWLTGKATVSHGEFHMNLIFAEADKFEAFIAEYADVFKPQPDPETGGVIFKGPTGEGAYTYLPNDKEYLTQLAAAVRKHGGFFAHVHPRQTMQSTNIEDYWFGDWTGLEVQYTYGADRNSAKSQANYQLWKDLLAAGKKIYATAGNDDHDMPTVKALTTIYAPENTAVSLVEQMREGNFNPGPVGIRMAIGDIPMGKEGDFTGKKLTFVIGDIHESELAGDHNYRVDLYKGGEVVQSWDMHATGDNFYQVVEIDENADFYRLEVIDIEGDTIDRVALSQPIWNTK